MSRRRRDRVSSSRFAAERDLYTPVIRSLGDLLRPDPIIRRHELLQLEDRRLFTPSPISLGVSPWKPAKARNRAATRLVVRPATQVARPSRFALLSPRIAFQDPSAVSICARRRARREVLHALQVAGRRGVGRGRPRHRNEFSGVGC